MRMVCEAVSGYICNMEIYSAEGKKLENAVLSLLDRNLGQNDHIYQDTFYNSVKLAQTLLERKVSICSTMRANRGIPSDLEEDGRHLKKGQSMFRRKGDVMVQVWKDKRFVRMIRTIHDATVVSTGRKDTKINMEIKKPYAVIRPPLWSSGQSFWLQIQRSWVRFPALPDFLSSSGSGTGSTQPREVN